MAMKPALKEYFSQRSWWHLSNGSTLTNKKVGYRSLGNITTNVGDYVSPLNHAYTSTTVYGVLVKRRLWIGERLWETEDGVSATPYTPETYFPSTFEPNALASALVEAYDKLRGNIDVSVDLVQWRATLKMVASYRRAVFGLVQVAKGIKPLIDKHDRIVREVRLETSDARRRRRTRELNDLGNEIAAMRLQYMYGVKPTMQTLHDLATKAIKPEPGLLRCEGKGRVIRESVTNQFSMSTNVPLRHKIRISDRARVVLYFNPPQSILTQLSEISTLNPVGLLYEATPFSFVVDWLYDFGSWIRTLETAFIHKNNYVDGYQTLTQRTSIQSIISGVEGAGTFARTTWFGRGDATQSRFSRTRLSTAPFPINPVKQTTFGVTRQLNAIALAKVVLLRGDSLARVK